mgnify:CR=1 FL=1
MEQIHSEKLFELLKTFSDSPPQRIHKGYSFSRKDSLVKVRVTKELVLLETAKEYLTLPRSLNTLELLSQLNKQSSYGVFYLKDHLLVFKTSIMHSNNLLQVLSFLLEGPHKTALEVFEEKLKQT